MAKRKKTRKTSKPWVVLHTSCGEANQLEGIGYDTEHKTEADARAMAAKYVEENGYDTGILVVAQIVDIAKSSGITWTGKTSL